MNHEEEIVEMLERIALALETIAGAQSQDYAHTPEGLPICPKHGVPMRKREKQGDMWYSHQVVNPTTGEILYCRGYASKSSPGWDIEPQPADPNATSSRPITRNPQPAVPSEAKNCPGASSRPTTPTLKAALEEMT